MTDWRDTFDTRPADINCYRCGQPGYTDWVEVTAYGDREPRWLPGEQYCVTPGCVDETGSRRLTPPSPSELRGRADASWMRRQEGLVNE